jgi:glucose-6-phosphate isomerase
MFPNHNPINTKSWQKLEVQFLTMQATHMRELFHDDPDRFSKFHAQFEDILVDYSKNLITEETIKDLVGLAHEVDLKDAIEAMFRGVKINATENRSVLHTALRNRSKQPRHGRWHRRDAGRQPRAGTDEAFFNVPSGRRMERIYRKVHYGYR